MKTMYCPKCHNELINGKERRFETLCDHVCSPNIMDYPLRPTFSCSNPECECGKQDVFWDDSGDIYGGFGIEFKNDRGSAYPSISAKLDTEIYKKGLKRAIYLHPCLTLWLLKPVIEYNYTSDDCGNVLKRSFSLKWLKKDRWRPWMMDRFGYHTYYSFPIPIIYRSLKNTKKMFNECSELYIKNKVVDILKPIPDWDERWWRHFEKWLIGIVFRKQIKKYIKA